MAALVPTAGEQFTNRPARRAGSARENTSAEQEGTVKRPHRMQFLHLTSGAAVNASTLFNVGFY